MNGYQYKAIIETKDGSVKKRNFHFYDHAKDWVLQWLNFVSNIGLSADYIEFSINSLQ